MSKRAKLSQLFDRGKELTFPDASGGVVVMWVNKLNPFQTEECQHEGRVARARRMLAIREIGTPEYDLFQGQVAASTRDEIIDAMASGKRMAFLSQVFAGLRSDPEWKDRLLVIEHSDSEEIETRSEDDPERALLGKVVVEYTQEIEKRLGELMDDYKAELRDLAIHVLHERFQEQWIDNRGLDAFTKVRQQYEVFHALRECEATPPAADERWDHSRCDHSVQYLDDPAEVTVLPDGLLQQILETLQAVTVPVDMARFTDGPASSSESSGPSSSAEGSTPSGPAARPGTPATTSS